MRYLYALLALSCLAYGQVIGGTAQAGGNLQMGTIGIPTPPPPSGFTADFFGGTWNNTPPGVWPPFDSQHNNFTLKLVRLWDDGVKWGQLETANGVYSTAFTQKLTTFLTTNLHAFPADVLYTFGDTPDWATMAGTDGRTSDTACASPADSSCIPPSDIDSNRTACNAVGTLAGNAGNANGSANSTVLANCGNGPNLLLMQFVHHLVTSFPLGTFDYLECWNEPDGAGNFWTNSTNWGGSGHAPTCSKSGGIGCEEPMMTRLVRACNDIKHVAQHDDPNIKIASPSFHGPTALTWMHLWVNTHVNDPGCTGTCSSSLGGATWAPETVSGKDTFTVPIIHARGSNSGTGEGVGNSAPENFLGAYDNMVTEINQDGLPKNAIDDEWGCINRNTLQCPTKDYLAYFMGAALALRVGTNANPVKVFRETYYLMDGAGGGGVIALQNTLGGTAFDQIANWTVGSSITGPCTSAGTVWQCPLLLNGSTPAAITWNSAKLNVTTLTGVQAASGGNTTYNCSGLCGGLAGEFITFAGFSAANNGAFTVVSSTGTTIVVNNPAGVAQTTSAGSGSYFPVTCGTACPNATLSPFHTQWTDLDGVVHAMSGTFPRGAKPILVQ